MDENDGGRVLARDEMHTIREKSPRKWRDGDDPTELVAMLEEIGRQKEDFLDGIRRMRARAEDELRAEGWPGWDARVVMEAGEWRECAPANLPKPRPGLRFMRGSVLIRERAEPLSRAFWLAELMRAIESLLDAPDGAGALPAACHIGALTEALDLRRTALGDLTDRRRAKAAFATANEGRDQKNRERKANAARWQARAREIAAEMGGSNSMKAPHVRRRLRDEGLGDRSESRIRQVIGGLTKKT